MVPPKKIQGSFNPCQAKEATKSSHKRTNSKEKTSFQPSQESNRETSHAHSRRKSVHDEQKSKMVETGLTGEAKAGLQVKQIQARLPPQNVRQMPACKPAANEKLGKPPKSTKQVLKPIEGMDDSQTRSTLKSDSGLSRPTIQGTEGRNPKLPMLDSQTYKLLDKVKRLTESNSKLSQEVSKLKAEIVQLKQNKPVMEEEEGSWNTYRDRKLKSELLRLRAENYKLKSSLQLNDRFGEVIVRFARESETICDACLEATKVEEGSEKKALEVLSEVLGQLFKLNSIAQNYQRDFMSLKEEQGTSNSREWDCSLGKADTHALQLLTEKVCGILFDLETSYADILNGINVEDMGNAGILKEFHAYLVKSSQALISKSLTLMNFSATKKSAMEMKKKLKAISSLDVQSQILKVESNLKESMKNYLQVKDGMDQKMLTADLQSFFSLRSEEDTQTSLCKMSGMIMALDNICQNKKFSQKLEVIEGKVKAYLARIDVEIAESVREMINFLDRTGFAHEVYLGYRYKVLNSLDNFFTINLEDRSGWTTYLEGLLEEVRACMAEFSKSWKQGN